MVPSEELIGVARFMSKDALTDRYTRAMLVMLAERLELCEKALTRIVETKQPLEEITLGMVYKAVGRQKPPC